MLQKQKRRFPSFDREILLHLLTLLAPKRRIGKDDVKAIFVLNIAKILCQSVGMNNVRRINAMQNHIHDGNHIRQTFLFFTRKRIILKCLKLFRR